MLYEMRTETLRPGAVPEYEERFAKVLSHRQKYSPLGAFWHTEIGTLNQVVHVWPYQDLEERARVRDEAARDPNWPAQVDDLVVDTQVEIMTPAPFMRPFGERRLGDIYEMRIYTYKPGGIPEVIKRWSEAIAHREKYSPLAAAWYSDVGGLNRWYHIWAYKDLAERSQIRAQANKDPHWPVLTYEWLIRNECKVLVPAPFSPMR